jgi:predicted O-methyltransferase YrrM
MARNMWHLVRWAGGFAPAQTQTSEAERQCLVNHAAGRRRLAEIGVFEGVTTCLLRRAMASDGVLFAIDPYPVGRIGFSAQWAIAHREVERVGNGRVHWLRTTGAEAARDPAVTAAPIDLLFIDGDHSYDGLRADWEGWSTLIARGGAVALHDSRPAPTRPIQDAGSVRYTTAVVVQDVRFEVVSEVESLTVLRRRPT